MVTYNDTVEPICFCPYSRPKFGGFVEGGLYIKRVIYNKPAVITFWSDGTKTVSKCGENDVFNPVTGLLLNYTKKLMGGESVNNLLKDWAPESSDYCGEVTLRDVRKRHKKDGIG